LDFLDAKSPGGVVVVVLPRCQKTTNTYAIYRLRRMTVDACAVASSIYTAARRRCQISINEWQILKMLIDTLG